MDYLPLDIELLIWSFDPYYRMKFDLVMKEMVVRISIGNSYMLSCMIHLGCFMHEMNSKSSSVFDFASYSVFHTWWHSSLLPEPRWLQHLEIIVKLKQQAHFNRLQQIQ